MKSIMRSIRGRSAIAALAAGVALSATGCVIDIGGIDVDEDGRSPVIVDTTDATRAHGSTRAIRLGAPKAGAC